MQVGMLGLWVLLPCSWWPCGSVHTPTPLLCCARSRYFQSAEALVDHNKSKPHKRKCVGLQQQHGCIPGHSGSLRPPLTPPAPTPPPPCFWPTQQLEPPLTPRIARSNAASQAQDADHQRAAAQPDGRRGGSGHGAPRQWAPPAQRRRHRHGLIAAHPPPLPSPQLVHGGGAGGGSCCDRRHAPASAVLQHVPPCSPVHEHRGLVVVATRQPGSLLGTLLHKVSSGARRRATASRGESKIGIGSA